jgi:L-aspartate oxidase
MTPENSADAAGTFTFDFVVLGSGIAGLTFALDVADLGTVALVTKKDRTESNTNWAQGGIAGVMAPDDSFNLHVEDTLVAGAGLCHKDAVEVLVREGPDRIRDLIDFGANFDKETGSDGREHLKLTREGGHSRRRIAYNADLTGKEIERALIAQANSHAEITVFEHHVGIDMAKPPGDENRVCGVYVLDTANGDISTFPRAPRRDACDRRLRSRVRPHDEPRDCHRRRCRDGVPGGRDRCRTWSSSSSTRPRCSTRPLNRFLSAKAVRGEGGILRDKSGRAFMDDYDARGNLAPRDIVARAIDAEMKRQNAPVYVPRCDALWTRPRSGIGSPTSTRVVSVTALT